MASKRVIAKWDYESQGDGFLPLKANEELETYGPPYEDYYYGRNASGICGRFPVSYVEEITTNEAKFIQRPKDNDSFSSNGDNFSDDEIPIEIGVKKILAKPKPKPRNYFFDMLHPCNLPRFTGKKNSIKVFEWIRLYENDDCHMEDQKVKKLMKHLDGTDALTWYAQEIAQFSDSITWSDCKQRMLEHFGANNLRPIVAAFHIKFKENDTIKTYFNEKSSLLDQTNLLDVDKVAMLTDGMPNHYQPSLSPSQIKSPAQWLKHALNLEETFKLKIPGHLLHFNNDNDDDLENDMKKMKVKDRPPRYTSKYNLHDYDQFDS
jgi:hypothetical protein